MKLQTLLRPVLYCTIIFGLFHSVQAKEYFIPELQVEVQINKDGSVQITEHRTYVFDGSYSWANYRIPKAGSSAIENIQIAENGENYTNLNTEEPGSFLVDESSDAFNIKWFFNANDEERVFSVSYTIRGALTVGPKWSQFFWNYAASGREKSTDRISIMLKLPEMVSQSDIHSWIREPAWKITSSKTDDGFHFIGDDIHRSQAVIIRSVFPTAVLNSGIEINYSDFSLEWAKNDEAEYLENKRELEAEQARLYEHAKNAVLILSGLSIICFIFFYRKYGTRHKINFTTNNSIMIPGRQKPALIGWLLMNQTITGGHVTATLLDLAKRGYFKIKEIEEEEKEESWFSSSEDKSSFGVYKTESDPNSDTTITEWEKDLYTFVEKRIDDEGHKMEDVFKFTDSEVSKWFYAWKKKLKKYAKQQNWYDQESYTGCYWNLGIQSLLLIIGVVLIFLLHPVMAIGMGISFVGAVLSLAIVRRTPKGEEVYNVWKNYRNALKNAKDYSVPDDKLGLHFIYGIALGLNKQNFEQMFEQNPDAVLMITWITILPGSSANPASMASSFSNLAATGTISAGGGASGGGASAGAAGGGASGGAG